MIRFRLYICRTTVNEYAHNGYFTVPFPLNTNSTVRQSAISCAGKSCFVASCPTVYRQRNPPLCSNQTLLPFVVLARRSVCPLARSVSVPVVGPSSRLPVTVIGSAKSAQQSRPSVTTGSGFAPINSMSQMRIIPAPPPMRRRRTTARKRDPMCRSACASRTSSPARRR